MSRRYILFSPTIRESESASSDELAANIGETIESGRASSDLRARDSRLDFLRGVCLIIMVINHLPPMRLQKLTYETLGFITSAEGFILISGITSGMVYARAAQKARRIFQRWRDIYLTYAVVMGTLLLLASLLGGPQIPMKDWFFTLAGVVGPLGHAVSGGILLIYLVLLPFLPFILRQFEAGGARFVLCASFGLWLLGQSRVGPEISVGYVFAWQSIFILGAWVGYCRRANTRIPGFSSPLTLKIVAISFVLLFLCRHPMIRPPILSLSWAITNKEQVGIMRLIDVSMLAFLIARIPRSFDARLLTVRFCRLVCLLGRHSLQVFSWHVVIVWVSRIYQTQWEHFSLSIQLCMTTIIVLSLFLPASLHERWKSARPVRVAHRGDNFRPVAAM